MAVLFALMGCKQAPVEDPSPAAPEARVPDAVADAASEATTADTLDEAKAAYDQRDLAAARALLDRVLRAEPGNARALLLQAQVELELEHPEAARAIAVRCVEIDPSVADCWLTIGVTAQEAKDDSAAVKAYETYLTLAPEGDYAPQVERELQRLRRPPGP